MDYCEAGSLADIMHKKKQAFREVELRLILRSILKALTYLHSHKILHRDIKAANILVGDGGAVKVADFGVSTIF